MSQTDPKYGLYTSLVGCINYVQVPYEKDIDNTRLNLEILDIRRNLNSKNIFPYIYR